jgi:hypothetical protein
MIQNKRLYVSKITKENVSKSMKQIVSKQKTICFYKSYYKFLSPLKDIFR